MNPAEHPEEAGALLTPEERGYLAPGTSEESTNPDGGLQPGMDSGHTVMEEEVVTNQELGDGAAAEGFSVSEVLTQTQLVVSCPPSAQ